MEEMVQRERDVKVEKQLAKERLEREKEMAKHLQTTMEGQRFAEDEKKRSHRVRHSTVSLLTVERNVFQPIEGRRGIQGLRAGVSGPFR
jgi:hypothetical protein